MSKEKNTNTTKTKQDVFNPVKDDKDGIIAKRMIWSSKSLELALSGILAGRKLVANPFYEKNTSLLKGDLVFDRTQDEIKEWLKCKNDILYHVIEQYIHQEAPLASVIDAKYEPVIGGVIAGLEKLYGKIGKEIQENINESAKKFGLIRSKM